MTGVAPPKLVVNDAKVGEGQIVRKLVWHSPAPPKQICSTGKTCWEVNNFQSAHSE